MACGLALALPTLAGKSVERVRGAGPVDWEAAEEVQPGVRIVERRETVCGQANLKADELWRIGDRRGRVFNGVREMRAYFMRVDLKTPGLKFAATRRDSHYGEPMPDYRGPKGETMAIVTRRVSVPEFMVGVATNRGVKVLAGWNTCFFRPWVKPFDRQFARPIGFNVSEGEVLTDDTLPRPDCGLFVVGRDGAVGFSSEVPTDLSNVWIAHTGGSWILKDGKPVPVAPNGYEDMLMPRLTLGLSRDRRYLFVLAVDGRRPGWSWGANGADLVRLMLAAGAFDAIDFDGGGSTTACYWDDALQSPRNLNVAEGERGRRVGVSICVYLDEAK